MEEDQAGKVDSKVIQSYIDKQMTIKLQGLKEELDSQIDNFQLEMIRQF
jgi:hypothetical protein